MERTPRMLGVQAAGAAPVTDCFQSGEALRPMEPHTIADSIAVGVPRNWKKAVLAVRESGGSHDQRRATMRSLDAMRYTGRLAGVFAEPAAATAVAGLRRAVAEGVVGRRARAVAIVTGQRIEGHPIGQSSRRRTVRDPAGRRRNGGHSRGKGTHHPMRETSLLIRDIHTLVPWTIATPCSTAHLYISKMARSGRYCPRGTDCPRPHA